MAGTVLTNKATFACAHSAPVTVADGITISTLGTHLTINGAQPIAAGATIAGFIAGVCTYAPGGTPDPCLSFVLTTALPSETHLQVDGKTVYTSSDLVAIKAVHSSGNSIPGLTIVETEVLVSTT
jgi:hypothetical protein